MAEAGKEGKDCNIEELSAKAGSSGASTSLTAQESHSLLPTSVAEDMHTALLAIAQRAPYVWPTGLNNEREEFSSICVAGVDFESSNSMERPSITLQLCKLATWKEAESRKMEMFTGRYSRRRNSKHLIF